MTTNTTNTTDTADTTDTTDTTDTADTAETTNTIDTAETADTTDTADTADTRNTTDTAYTTGWPFPQCASQHLGNVWRLGKNNLETSDSIENDANTESAEHTKIADTTETIQNHRH